MSSMAPHMPEGGSVQASAADAEAEITALVLVARATWRLDAHYESGVVPAMRPGLNMAASLVVAAPSMWPSYVSCLRKIAPNHWIRKLGHDSYAGKQGLARDC